MNSYLKYRLERMLNEWVDENCENEDRWPMKNVMGSKTVIRMADAAEAVFDATMEVQDMAVREGFMKWAHDE